MRKILVLSFIALLFVACNFAKNAAKFKPDIVVTGIDPISNYVAPGGGTTTIAVVGFKPRNSIDAYMKGFTFTYYDVNNTVIYGPSELFPLYIKIDGIVDPDSVDSVAVINLQLPTDTVATYLINNNLYSAKAQLYFIFTDQYEMGTSDTAMCWFGLYRLP